MLQLNALPQIRKPENSLYVGFAKGTEKRTQLVQELEKIRSNRKLENLPLWINGPVRTKEFGDCVVPHDNKRLLARYCKASEEHVVKAINTILRVREKWHSLYWRLRLLIFQKAARLLETKYFVPMVAAVMEDYSKNPHEASIDVQELIDFLNFNCWFAFEIYNEQPGNSADFANTYRWRPLEGFVYAIPPNNFLAIEGNLPTAPLIMGNVVLAKPSSDVVYSFHLFLKILHEAGLPKDVLAVVQGNSAMISDIVLEHDEFAGVNFTGSTEVFEAICSRIGQNIGKKKYRGYPRAVGETGGKNAVVVFPDYNARSSAEMILRGAFGYQGQKCSATSRVYVDEKTWPVLREHLREISSSLNTGDVADFKNFMNAIINAKARDNINSYIEHAVQDVESGGVKEVMMFGRASAIYADVGYFVDPTIIVTKDPFYRTMQEEIFGPVLTVCALPAKNYKKRVFELCDKTSAFGLTGAVHTDNIYTYAEALKKLENTAGNYNNTMTTGAIVWLQPFSGGRKSGTNSKVGGKLHLYNWTLPGTVGFSFLKPPFAPPYLDQE